MELAGTALALVVASVLLLVWMAVKSKAMMIANKIPGVPPIPFFGNAHTFKSNGADFITQLMGYAELYGSKTGIFRAWVGHHLAVCCTRAETTETVLSSSKLITKSFMYQFIMPWLGTGLLTSTGEKWRTRRHMLTPSFHFKILGDFLQVFNEQSKIMVDRLEKRVGKGTFDMSQYITLCTLDIICDTAMGKHVNAQSNSDSEYVKAIYRISEIVMKRMKSPWYYPDIIFNMSPIGGEHNQKLKILHGFTNSVIRERRKEQEKDISPAAAAHAAAAAAKELAKSKMEDDSDYIYSKRKRLAFLDLLLDAEGSDQLTDNDIREEVDTFMFEGHDTTAAAISWAIHLIGEHPEVQDKLHQEIDKIFGDSDRPITMDDIKNLKYLECIIKESLRIYPSVPLFAREITENTEINGYFIPKGASIFVLVLAIHRDPRYFPDPNKFDPDRWLPENSVGRHPYAFIPFSAGMRNCIGQKFAMMEEKVLLTYILRRFHVKSALTQEELRPSGELILRPEAGIQVDISKRKV